MNPIKTLLDNDFQNRRARNANYSLRAYARDLGVSPSRLSQFFNNQSELSTKNVEKIVGAFKNLSEEEKTNILLEYFNYLKSIEENGQFERELSSEEFEKIFTPIHYWILTSVELDRNLNEHQLMQAFKEYDKKTIQNAIGNLKDLELIKESRGILKPTKKGVKTGSDIPSCAIRKYHKSTMDAAIRQIDLQDVNQRDYSSITIATNPKQLQEAKKLLAQTRRKIAKILQAKGKKTKVYNLSMQLFEIGNFEV